MQWQLVQGIVLVPVGLAFIGSFFINDTPRWLAYKDRGDEALETLMKLRGVSDANDRALATEYEEIHQQLADKQRALADDSMITILKEIAVTPSYRKRF